MKKFALLPLAALAFTAACGDSSKGLLAPEGGPEFHAVSTGGSHPYLKPTITAPTPAATESPGAVTISWQHPTSSQVERWVYSIACTGAECTAVPEQTVGSTVLAASATLAAGEYTLSVRGEKSETKTTGQKTTTEVHSYSQIRTFTVTDPTPADKSAPTITCDVVDAAKWYNDNVTVNCIAEDAGSGLANAADASFSLSTNIAAGSEDASASTGSKTVTDNAGNSATINARTFKVDRKAPEYTCDDAPTGWQNGEVVINCQGSDTGSGIIEADASFTLSTSVGAGSETSSASTATRQLTDNAGNHATAAAITGLKVDRKAPIVTCNAAPTFILGASPANVTAGVQDGGSGPASATVSQVGNTTTVGSKTVSISGSDNVGNSASALCGYSVVYGNSKLFLSPIPQTKTDRAFKAGSVIPVKFQLTDATGALISDELAQAVVANISVRFVSGESISEATEAIAGASADSGTTFRYDAVADQFIFNLKTAKTWNGTYRITAAGATMQAINQEVVIKL